MVRFTDKLDAPLDEAEVDFFEPQQVQDVNLAETLDAEILQKVGREVLQDFMADYEANTERLERIATSYRTYYQQAYNGTSINADPVFSKVNMPILTEACDQFMSRSYKTFFGQSKFVTAFPNGEVTEDKLERAERVANHMSWQLGVKDYNYKRAKRRSFLAIAIAGEDYTKTIYDRNLRQPVVMRVPASQMILPFNSGEVPFDELHRKSEIIYFSYNRTRQLARSGYFTHPCSPVSGTGEIESALSDVISDATGVQMHTEESSIFNQKCIVIEQHCYLDLSDDGFARPYIVWLDLGSRKVLRIVAGYEINAQGEPLDEMGNVTKEFIQIPYYTQFIYSPDPLSVFGRGLGDRLTDIDEATTKIMREAIDAAMLANKGNMGGFISESTGISGGAIDAVIGKFRKINDTGSALADKIYQMRFPGPNPSMLEMMNFMLEYARRLSGSAEVLSGQVEKVLPPTTILTMVEQALESFTSVQQGIAESLQEEFSKIYRLNRIYMREPASFSIGKDSFAVTPDDYRADFLVTPRFDPNNYTEQQRVARAEMRYRFAMENPIIAQNPKAVFAASRAYALAMNIENVDELLPESQEEQEIVRIDDQAQENFFFMLPQESRPLFDVFPDQDHAQHIKLIDDLLVYVNQPGFVAPPLEAGEIDQVLNKMTQEAATKFIATLLAHRSKHLAFLTMQEVEARRASGNSEFNQTGLS